ncbi:hypothetical protein GCM10022243_23780 [Saccharothrix violaceirubra]|uniref:Uncharacterized protein n=1 Tax=Saccharothrix violaceirubra TaxID=413306 RepID=A0A7W7T748_9PSEU|nr:hypothetical protein [Saccharothrix violaceirubra]MBB4967823.1 hypothetical protein [Saccharothrix violaceirubra]
MTNPSRRGRFLITNAHFDGPRWKEQKDKVAALAHGYDNTTQQWHYWFDLDQPPVDTINTLFRLARVYGTTVNFSIHEAEPRPETTG